MLYAKIRLVSLYGSIYQYFTFFANNYLFHLVLLLKITLFNTVHCDGKNLTRLHDKDVTSGKSWKKLELTLLSERICGLKLVQIEPRLTHQKRELCWITNWKFCWSRSYVQHSLKIPSQYETYTWGYVAPPSVLPIH